MASCRIIQASEESCYVVSTRSVSLGRGREKDCGGAGGGEDRVRVRHGDAAKADREGMSIMVYRMVSGDTT